MPPALPSDDDAYRERYFALRQENQYLRQRLVEIESDVTGPLATTNRTDEVEKLKTENEQLQNQLSTLTSASRAQTNEWVARINQLDEERAALATENELLKRELEKAKAEVPAAATVDVQPAGAMEVLQIMHKGLAQERSSHFTAALDIYEHVISERPSYAEALKAKGRCLLQLGQFDEATAVFRDVVFANRDDVPSHVLLGTAYCLAGKYGPAVEALTPLVENDPSNARAQSAIGAAWMGLGDLRAAKIALEKAVSLDPELADAHFNLAQVLLAAGPENADKARDHYRKALTLGEQPDEKLAKALGSL